MKYYNLLDLPTNTPIYALYLRGWDSVFFSSPPEIYYGKIRAQKIKWGVGTDIVKYFYQYDKNGVITDDEHRIPINFDFQFFDTKQELIDYYNSAIQKHIDGCIKSIEHHKKMFMNLNSPVNRFSLADYI